MQHQPTRWTCLSKNLTDFGYFHFIVVHQTDQIIILDPGILFNPCSFSDPTQIQKLTIFHL